MQTKQIGIILLIGLLTLGVIGAGIPYTTSQFIWQSTDLNYTKFYAGEYDGNGLIIDGNIFTIFDLNGLGGSGSFTDTNFETAGFTTSDINNALIDLNDYVRLDGTNMPFTDVLSVTKSAESHVTLLELINSSESGYGTGIEFWDNNGETVKIVGESSGGGGQLTVYVADGSGNLQERITVERDGKVGIGTTSPATALDVNGTITVNNIIKDSVFSSSKITFGNSVVNSANNDIVLKSFGGNVNVHKPSTVADSFIDLGFLISSNELAAPVTYIRTYRRTSSTDNDMVFHVGGNDVMYLDNNTNVGIGTTTPTEKLEVSGNIFLTNDSDIIYLGAGKDFSQYFDGTNQNFDLTSGNFVFNADIQTTGSIKGVHKTADGTNAVADGEYVMGIGNDTNGSITIKDGLITSITEAN